MLTLTRRPGQRVIIRCGSEIITVTLKTKQKDQGGTNVLLGFEASEYVQIDREEVYQDKLKKGKA